MRDFLEDLGKRLGETAETMTNKAGEAIEIQKLKSQIRSLARGNAVDLVELGRTIYDRYKNGEEVDENAQSLCESIQKRELSIEGYEKKIARLKGASECIRCGRMVAKDMAFCPYCGEKIETSVYEETEVDEETNYADAVKEKVVDATEKAAGKADEAAKMTADFADEAAKKTSDFAEKAAKKTGDMAEKAAQKVSEAAEKAADKLSEAADKMKKNSENPE